MDKADAKSKARWIAGAIALVFILWRGYEAANGRGNVLLSGIVGGGSYAIGYAIVGLYYKFVREIDIFSND